MLERDLRAREHAALIRKEVGTLVSETAAFIAALSGLPAEGSMEERQAALRRCVQRIVIRGDQPAIAIEARTLPTIVSGPEALVTATIEAGLSRAASAGTR